MSSVFADDETARFDVEVEFRDGRRKTHRNVSPAQAKLIEGTFDTDPQRLRITVIEREGRDLNTADVYPLGDALRAIHERLIYARREGAEWASEFLTEEWPDLVPENVRAMLGLDDED